MEREVIGKQTHTYTRMIWLADLRSQSDWMDWMVGMGSSAVLEDALSQPPLTRIGPLYLLVAKDSVKLPLKRGWPCAVLIACLS